MSYSGFKSPRGSRGYSSRGYSSYRGSSRGGGDGSGWRGSGSRGYSSSSRGSSRGGRYSSNSGKWDRESSSYESRPKYYSAGGERYSSQSSSRPDGSSYRYRSEDSISSYTSRDHSHRASSPDRKRMRPDYSPASSVHRSHEYGDSNEFSSRSYSGSGGGYEGKRMGGGYQGGEDRRAMFREERERIRSDDYQFRKPLSVGGRFSRGTGFRGRSFSRGMRSSFRREPSSYHPRGGFIRKRPMDGGYGNRRIVTGKTQEYLRRLKLYRMQRLKRLQAEGGELDSDENEEEEEIEEEVEEEVTDEDQEEANDADATAKTEGENEDVEMREDEEGGEEKKDVEKKVKKVKKVVVKVVRKIKRKLPKKEDDEDDAKDKDETQDIKEKGLHVTVTQDSEGRDVETPVRTNYLGQPFMKLECPHCHFKAETFKDYLHHLYRNKHQQAMTNLTMKVRKALAKLRLEQRAEQRVIDEECKLKKMNMRTFYCLTCKLNYKSLKSEHMQSEKHKEMKKFTTPFCKVCRVTCRTPMLYENHVCSLDHLKRKFYYDKKNAERQEGGNDIDMDKFMVLDQVGSGEEDSDAESSEKEGKDKEATAEGATEEGGEKAETEKKPKKKKKAINLGSEFCKKMEIYFCDLCKTFLPRIDDQEQALAVHCRGRTHLHWYVKKKDDLALRKRAERIHRMREELKKAESKEAEAKDEPMDEDVAESDSKTDKGSKKAAKSADAEMEGVSDGKNWTDVNKDMNEIIKETEEQGNKSSDDEEDSRTAGRRYDRFKHSEEGKVGDESESKSNEEKGVKKAEIVNGDDKDDA